MPTILHCVPWIIDYQTVLERMLGMKLVCGVMASGAFAFPPGSSPRTVVWATPQAALLPKPEGATTILFADEADLAERAVDVWQTQLQGPAWVLPVSHWAYELDYGSREWLPPLLERLDLDLLAGRPNAAALEFSRHETERLRLLTDRLLQMLMGSEFLLAFPAQPVLCTVTHEKQLRWTSTDLALMQHLAQQHVR
jgi:hypothetical protein